MAQRRSILTQIALVLFFCCYLVQAQEVRKPDYKKNPHYKKEHRLVITHGVTGALAWVIFFPLGAILLRLLKGKTSFWLHAGIQTFSVALFTVTVGTGIAIIHGDQLRTYHPVIGLVIFSLVFVQVIGGILHHLLYKKLHRRTIISYTHLWLGRILITLGMINGGLGLMLAGDNTTENSVAYGVVTGVIWLVFVGVSVWYAVKERQVLLSEAEKNGDGYLKE